MSKDKQNNGAKPEDEQGLEKTCFVIMPIADHKDYSPGHFGRVYDHIITPACKAAGYKPDRADRVNSSNLIMFNILKSILNADMAICDLSSRNPNVLYELAVRQCFGLPVVLIKDNDTLEPFDASGIRYIEYDSHLRVDLVEVAVKTIKAGLEATESAKADDVFSLLQILGREKATVKPNQVDPMMLNILDQLTALRNQQNSTNLITNDSILNAFIPMNEVFNMIQPPFGVSLNSLGLAMRVDVKIGAKVAHKITAKTGVLIGIGSARGTGVFIVKVDDGPTVAASPDMYFEVAE